jgi:hypothetical protein
MGVEVVVLKVVVGCCCWVSVVVLDMVRELCSGRMWLIGSIGRLGVVELDVDEMNGGFQAENLHRNIYRRGCTRSICK